MEYQYLDLFKIAEYIQANRITQPQNQENRERYLQDLIAACLVIPQASTT